MVPEQFRALVLEEGDGKPRASFRTLPLSALPEGDVLVQVVYSSLNYKDGLAITGKGKIIRSFPCVPGIDLAGTVVESASPEFKPGDQVVLTGWGIGERHWGGYSQMARVRSQWLVPLPEGFTPEQAMAVGTAGFTAMLCVMALEEHGINRDRPVVVTGAAGGVGSVAVALLARRGYHVVASTGRPELHDYLRRLGAAEFIDRQELATPSGRPLESERWGGAVDTVGGDTLASLLRAMSYGCSVASCGLAGGSHLNTTVFPFILRGVNLLGIDSVYCPMPRRREAWRRLAEELPADLLAEMTTVRGLSEILDLAEAITEGQIRGRVVIDVNR